MRIEKADPTVDKGWYTGPWNSNLAISVGYASEGLDDPHVHRQTSEIYLIARGASEMLVEGETVTLQAGDMIVIEPGEAHTFLSNSPGYFHFVLHTPGVSAEETDTDRHSVSRSRLGL